MALLSNFVGGNVPGQAYKQPAFACWSNNGSQGGWSIYDHNFHCMGRFMLNNSNVNGGGAMTSTGANEMTDTFAGSAYATSNNVPSSSGEYGQPQYNGYLGNCLLSIGFTMGSNGCGDLIGSTYYENRGEGLAENGVIVNEPNQDYAIFSAVQNIVIGPRSMTWYVNSFFTSSKNEFVVTAKQSGYSTISIMGRISYNAKTKKVCIIESNGSFGSRPTVYSAVPNLRYYASSVFRGVTEQYAAYAAGTTGPLYDFFNTAANYTTTYVAATGKPANSGTEDNYRGIPVMCDNNKIVWIQMIRDNNVWMSRWNADGTHTGALINRSLTTSRGSEAGYRYGIRYQVSSDGRYVLVHCPYYYFGSGTKVFLVRVSDGKTIWDESNDTTYGFFYTPIGKSDFVMLQNVNADGGAGIHHQSILSDALMNQTEDLAQTNMCRSYVPGFMHTNFYSTDYPMFASVQYDTALFNVNA
jgi:hypothetical protein